MLLAYIGAIVALKRRQVCQICRGSRHSLFASIGPSDDGFASACDHSVERVLNL